MSTARKEFAWSIRGRLFTLSSTQLFELAKSLTADSGDTAQFSQDDKESCMNCVASYIQSETLLGLEDEGMSQLLALDDLISQAIQISAVDTPSGVTMPNMPSPHPSNMPSEPPPSPENQVDINANVSTETQSIEELRKVYEELGKRLKQCEATVPQPTVTPSHQSHPHFLTRTQLGPERPVTVRDLSYLSRREFKAFGGQIGDNSSEISYNSLTKQINEGIKEGFGEAEIVKGVLRIVKHGTFRDMLMLKDELSLPELQGFLRSHLGEKATTEMFQELMCARQTEQESPQQFLYRMIGLKQKLNFQSKQASTDISYDPKTIQEVFLHTIYQGLGVKYADMRQRLRPLTLNNNVTDEEILREVTKIISEENEHQRRLGQTPRQKTVQAQSAVLETDEKEA